MADGQVFIVTGANKGIGYGIVRNLAKQVKGAVIYLTARNEALGRDALKKVTDELKEVDVVADIRFHQLDVTNEESSRRFAEHLKKEHGGFNVLINNAGVAFPLDSTEPLDVRADVTIGINYYGTKLVSDTLVPLIQAGGRIVNVCSQAGLMSPDPTKTIFKTGYSQERIDYFRNPNLQVTDIDSFVEAYKKATRENNREEQGFPDSDYSEYRVSKAAEIALTLIQARELEAYNVVVNACCPGYVDTDMTGHKGTLTLDEGADTPIYLATEPNLPSGQFWYKRKPKDWLTENVCLD